MKKFIVLFLIIFATSIFAGCKTKTSSSCYLSPEALVDYMSAQKDMSEYNMLQFIAPDERAILAFAMDMSATFAVMFMGNKDVKKQVYDVKKKYGVKDITKMKTNINQKDFENLKSFANENYGNIDIEGFIKDISQIFEKLPGAKAKEKKFVPEDVGKLEDLKVDGDYAKGYMVDSKGKKEMISFRKYNGCWYLTLKDSFK